MNNNPNEHIEKTLIGILLSPGDVYKEIISQIDVHHFEHELCRKTFRLIK